MILKMFVQNLLDCTRMEQNKVIVIGGSHHNTLGVVRSLGYKGLKSHLIVITEKKRSYVCSSKYVCDYKILQSANEIVEYLLKVRKRDSKSVIISCADFVTAVLDSNQDRLVDYYYLPVAKGNVQLAMDKNVMASKAQACGLSIPRIFSAENMVFSSNKKYILKPLKSIEGSKADIKIVSCEEELSNYLSSKHCKELQIQEYIDKELEFQLIGCSLNGGESIIIPGASIIIRQPENTNTGFLKYVGFDEFDYDDFESCKKFIQSLGYSGLFSIEFIRSKDGYDYFMEINMRNDGNSICVTAAGVNLPYIWYCYCVGSENWITESGLAIQRKLVMPEFNDFSLVLKRKVSFNEWLRDIKRTDCFMEYDKTDKKPFYIGLLNQFTNYFKLFFNKLHVANE